MILDLTPQAKHGPYLQPLPVRIYTGSALPLDIVGIPPALAGESVTGVSVMIVNADGITTTAPAVKTARAWCVTFAPSTFASFGFVAKGLAVSVATAAGSTLFAVADLEVVAATPDTQPGDPTRSFVEKGSDIYLKTYTLAGVQHYTKMQLELSERLGTYGADWTGDYILTSDGQYQEYTP